MEKYADEESRKEPGERSRRGAWTAEEFEAEYDPRLADVWISVFEMWPDQRVLTELGWFLRMAYTLGYGDALTEERGLLFQNLGLDSPEGTPKAVWSRKPTTGSKRGSAR